MQGADASTQDRRHLALPSFTGVHVLSDSGDFTALLVLPLLCPLLQLS